MRFFRGVSGMVHYRVWTAERPRAVAVLLHGLGQQSADYHRFARAVNRCGITVFGIDQIGHGLSEGEFGAIAPIADLAANALTLAAMARAAVPGVPLALIGHSLGAGTAVAAMAADSEIVERVAAVVLLGTPEQAAAQGFPPPEVPTLLLHGRDDRRAPLAPIRTWVAETHCRMVEFADAGHDLLHEPVHRQVTGEVIDFVLAARPNPVQAPAL